MMIKKIQISISLVVLSCCISAIAFNFKLIKERGGTKSNKEVNTTILQDKHIANTEVYNEFLKRYNYKEDNNEYYYTFIELDGYNYPILLLSDSVYEYKNERDVAMCTDVYYPINKKVTLFGNICSNGTAYPISANTTGIYTAGGHEVAKYNLDTQSLKLKLINKYIMFFHKTGEKVNTISIEIIGNENKIVSEEVFNKAYEEYSNAKIIYFKRFYNNK